MTTNGPDTNTPQSSAPTKDTPPPAPTVDVDKITKDATAAAVKVAEEQTTKLVGEKLRRFGAQLSGDGADPNAQVMSEFLKDPLNVLKSVKEVAKSEIREEHQRQAAHKEVQRAVATPFISDYPEINNPKKLAMVEKLAEDYTADGMSYADALKKGFEETVKEFGLKSVSEKQKEDSINHAGLPGGGGISPVNQRHDEVKSQSDFLTAMKAKAQAVRLKK